MSLDNGYRSAKASIYVGQDDAAWVVTQTPSEIAEMVRSADPEDLIEFTLGNESEWNSKPLYIRAKNITAISPPKNQNFGDEE
jgi:hypothetical protein